ncbi:MAG: phosphate/phosphite/phosphonate ABC transporter substrate-binding protein [Zoogloeaceae bacterium]|nr:phosphate/phosphite/phosphonate ABC transporter substrate-binding protein [Zoogloeaceae bacterium]
MLCLCALLFAGSVLAAQEQPALRVGIAPFNPPATLFKVHQPLRAHLEKTLGRKVMLYSSPSHARFLEDSLEDDFDIVITPPHFGVIDLQRGYKPLVRYAAQLDFIFVVRANDKSITRPQDLRNKKIAFPDRMALLSIGGMTFLREETGMLPKVDYQADERPNHAAAMMAAVLGETDAAVTTLAPFNQMPADVRSKLKIFSWGKKLPHLMSLAHSRLGEKEIQKIKLAFESFPATEAGRQFFLSTGYDGYVPITKADIDQMQPTVELTLEMMAEAP